MATKPRKNPIKPKVGNRGRKCTVNITPAILAEIELLAGKGLTNEQIHSYFGFTKSAFYNKVARCPELQATLAKGKAKGISFVSGCLMKAIKAGNVSAMIFYLKTQARWREEDPQLKKLDEDKPSLSVTINDPVEAAKVYQKIMQGS